MSVSVHEIEQAISRLAAKDLALFRRWFQEFDAQLWDEQIEQDAKTGKRDKLAERATTEYKAGNYKELWNTLRLGLRLKPACSGSGLAHTLTLMI
jgi:hypothetical protein